MVLKATLDTLSKMGIKSSFEFAPNSSGQTEAQVEESWKLA